MTTLDHPDCARSFRILSSTALGISHERRPWISDKQVKRLYVTFRNTFVENNRGTRHRLRLTTSWPSVAKRRLYKVASQNEDWYRVACPDIHSWSPLNKKREDLLSAHLGTCRGSSNINLRTATLFASFSCKKPTGTVSSNKLDKTEIPFVCF